MTGLTRLAVAVLLAAILTGGCAAPTDPPAARRPSSTLPGGTRPPDVEPLTHEVVATYPHDEEAFTQGLLVDSKGRLFESVGRYKRSDLREVDLTTGEVKRRQPNDPAQFAEGLAAVGDRLIQLTWKERVANVWRSDDFASEGSATYDTEGWGLCYDGSRLVMSDGSAELTFRDPTTFASQGEVTVRRGDHPVRRLNELECVDGKVYANVWQTDFIVVIDPATGRVVHEIDLTGLLPEDQREGADVLNGIAYRPDTRTFLVTGKLWPTLFELRFS